MKTTLNTLPAPLRTWFWLQALVLLIASTLALPALADPPTRAARVAEVSGQAWWYDPEQRDWQPLTRNQSVAEGDRLRVDERGRIGLRIGASSVWLGEQSQLEIVRLDDERTELALDRGALAMRWTSEEAAREAVVRTREGRFLFERVGAYRIDQLASASRGQAWEGRMRFEGRANADAPVWMEAPEQAELWWDGGPRAERSRSLRTDDFSQWLVAELGFGRGDRYARNDRPAYRYVSPEMTGADELDAYGRWQDTPDYGAVWIPSRVVVDWAPYRYGHWTWSRHWGWTWVDDNPWGYATSHYGRWVHWGGHWCWTPGARVVRPVFAPALVAWVGGGSVQVGVSIGSRWAPPVAWVPLAPRETFVPWYHHSPGYARRFNPDPVTVRRPNESPVPHRNFSVPGAVSTYVATQGSTGPVRNDMRPVPLRDDQVLRHLQPLPHGPARQDALPVRAAVSAPVEPQRQHGWHGESRTPEAALPMRIDARPEPQRFETPRAEPQRQELPTRVQPTPQVEQGWQRRVEPQRQDLPTRVQPAPIEREQGWQRREEPQRQESRQDLPMRVQPVAIEREQGWRREERREERREDNLPRRQIEVPRFEAPQRVDPPRQPEAPRMEIPRRQEAPQRVEPPRPPEPRKVEEKRKDKDDGLPRRDQR